MAKLHRNMPKNHKPHRFFPNTETTRTWMPTLTNLFFFSEILPLLSFFIEDCHAFNYCVLFGFRCDLDDLSCHYRALNQSKNLEHEALRLYKLTSGMEFHEVDTSLAKMVIANHRVNCKLIKQTLMRCKTKTLGSSLKSYQMPTVLKSGITTDKFFFTKNRDLKVVIAANRLMF